MTLAIASLALWGSCFLSWEIWHWNLLRHCNVMPEGCMGTQRCSSTSTRAINHPNLPARLENILAKVGENFTATTRQQLSTIFQRNPNNWLAQHYCPPSLHQLSVRWHSQKVLKGHRATSFSQLGARHYVAHGSDDLFITGILTCHSHSLWLRWGPSPCRGRARRPSEPFV